MNHQVPEDLLVEILSKLPVKSLVRFKCVCSSWNSLIQSQAFISKHTKNQQATCANVSLLICHRDNVSNKRVVSLLADADEDDDGGGEQPLIDKLQKHRLHDDDLPPFANDMFGHVRLIGPCNGLLCLYGYPDNIVLWNPAIRQFKPLPPSPIQRPPGAKVRGGDLAFGFDSTTHDYKVVQILFCISAQQVEIYSLSTNSWRKYDYSDMPANIMYVNNNWSMLLRNETFCWWAKDPSSSKEVILSFDMCREVFQKTPLPSDIDDASDIHRKIIRAVLPLDHESIALVVYGLKDVDKVFDIWTIKDLRADNNNTWNKMSRVGPLPGIERPLGFWKKGGLIILESSSRELVLYEPATQNIKKMGIFGKRDRLEVVAGYTQTLVSVSSQ